ncbi:hypothetical protein RHMOL_Rhmol13G0201600 [Rhododendron molle]|uniref:Uncharacterized protein n=1 Tax=Rhododendron molle TaxID=49168 RepID=A0ACC0LA29_RHOML|nr:hypothetical protein RHMOL_Rhmol13G0201600 [Rhododendron molle]
MRLYRRPKKPSEPVRLQRRSRRIVPPNRAAERQRLVNGRRIWCRRERGNQI